MCTVNEWPSSYDINYTVGCLHCGRTDTTLHNYVCNAGCPDESAPDKDKICRAVPGIWRNNGGRIESIVHDDMPPIIVATVGEVNNQTRKDTATANRIIHCCNLHEKLVAALQVAVARVAIANDEGDQILSAWLPEARAVLANCKKQGT